MEKTRHPICRPRRGTGHAARAATLLLLLAGCAGVGPQRLNTDQMGYAAALGDGQKQQMLLNMVRLRYADVPTFLTTSQIISGYTLQGTGQVGLNAYPNANPGNYATLSGTLEYTSRPTFTFTPVTGERFAQSYLRPLAAAELLSLAQSGAPIDLLFRLGVQSVNGLVNGAASGGEMRAASGGFEALMATLREVQAAGTVSLRFERMPSGNRVYLMLDGEEPRARAALRDIRRILRADASAREFEVVYGRHSGRPGQIAVLTRSVLQIFYELGAGIDVPRATIRRGDTVPAAPGGLIAVHQGADEPRDAFAAVNYRNRWYWIDAGDYASKSAFAFAYVLQILAESGQGQPTPVVTIPVQ